MELNDPNNPIYYRWSHTPEGGVDLSHDETHPLDIRFLSDLEQGDRYGYAYRLSNGWRLTDHDSRPVGDPAVEGAVERAIRAKESDNQQQSNWQFDA